MGNSSSHTQVFQIFDTTIDKVNRMPVIAPRYSFIFGCRGADTSRVWISNNAAIDTSSYFPSSRDNDPVSRPLSWWIANHPDWILYKSDQVTPAYLFGAANVPLDFSNSAVVSWQVTSIVQAAIASNTFTYMVGDNVNMNNAGFGVGVYAGATPGSQFSGTWTPLYSGASSDATYATAVKNWVVSMAAQCHANSIKFCPNFDAGSVALTDAKVIAVLAAVDGIFDEGGFTSYGNGNLSDAAWTNRIAYIQTIQSLGKQAFQGNILPVDTVAHRQYGLASYLMGKGSSASLAMVPLLSPNNPVYGAEVWYGEYISSNTLGLPLEAMTADQSMYRRTFAGGIVLVNPSSTATFNYTLTGNYVDLYGALVSGIVSFSPVTAKVLLNSPLPSRYSAFGAHA